MIFFIYSLNFVKNKILNSFSMEHSIERVLLNHLYVVDKQIGSGRFGVCYLVKSTKFDRYFVCKVNRIEKYCKQLYESVKQEADILSKLNHPNIVSIYDYFFEENSVFLILEYCEGGSLIDILQKKGRLSTHKMEKIALEVIDALAFMHEKGISHCDIKLSNILVDQFGRAKICDFGLSHIECKEESCIIKRGCRGTIHYLSPQMLAAKSYNIFKADVWALGVLFYAMNAGTFPFGAVDTTNILDEILSGNKQLSNKFGPIASIVNECLQINEMNRPTMQELKEKAIITLNMKLPKAKTTSRILSTTALHSVIRKKDSRRLSATMSVLPKICL